MLFLDYIPELSHLDFEIYKYITENIDKVIYMKIRDLADETHTSTASILRFCKKFDCIGFSDFKVKLSIHYTEKKNDTVKDIDTSTYIDFLGRVQQPFYQAKIQEAVEILKHSSMVLFIGSGASEVMAEYGALYYSNLFTFALRIEDPSNYNISFLPDKLSSNISIIALSVSGETQEVIHFLKDLKLRHCKVISITNTENSTISKLSDLNLPYFIDRETINKPSDKGNKKIELTSQLPVVYLLEAIAKKYRSTIISVTN
ncbi:MurR/RpiR family transcriptional regulator [Desemzia sp. RIT804]|uniref:MurR/RpiR family transcriptional regulator n=1 Tax=Desemzia sp. RIT 804 TaxID=2810209 RepID=UPI00194F3A95|nr:MurR/RpiR family transcriptional regulator [Desemzia sp. RIT 804]MBM6615296.1 MurR/RpiR family transcriptional regulator [Desemzia sp. RIT 804]